jgi:hypothetical protein
MGFVSLRALSSLLTAASASSLLIMRKAPSELDQAAEVFRNRWARASGFPQRGIVRSANQEGAASEGLKCSATQANAN